MRADSEEIVVEKRYLSTVPKQSAEVDSSDCVRTAASMADFWFGVQIVKATSFMNWTRLQCFGHSLHSCHL